MLRIAVVLILVYGCVLLANGLFYFSWSQDTSELPRMFVRVFGIALVAYGLWSSAKWGWWLGLVFSGIFTLLGIAGLIALFGTDLLDSRPYPTVDIVVFVISILALAGTFVCLISGTARAAIRNRNNATT